MKRVVLILLASCLVNAREPMVRYPGGDHRSHLSRKVDVDYTSSLNTENPDRVEFDIGPEVPSYYRGKVSTGVLR